MPRIATIGFFDGVHLGHRFLFAHLREAGSQRGLEPMIVTFGTHPREVLRMGYRPQLLTSETERVARLQHYGNVQVFDFAQIQKLTAEQFMRLLYDRYEVRCLMMGYDHRFGSDRLTSPDDYCAIGRKIGMEVLVMEQYNLDAEHVSSTEVRQAIEQGDIARANRLLGYPYTLTGTVVHGRGVGHQLGYPTANIALDEPRKLLPPYGVYVVEVTLPSGARHRAILNIGNNPTLGDNPMTIEVHIPDWTRDLYDLQLSVELIHFLRPERRFDSLDQLRTQIEHDIAML